MSKGPILKEGSVRWESRPRRTGPTAVSAASRPPAGADAQIHLRKNGDMIEAIEITCPCGHEMVLECLYDSLEGKE